MERIRSPGGYQEFDLCSFFFFGSVNHRKDFVASESMRRRVEILNSGEVEGTRHILLL
jgi:hypothetical protein